MLRRLLWRVMQVGAELGTTFNEVLAPQDVATYGALCSLASFSRPEMKTRIIDNIAFREFLELMPEVRTGTVQLRPQHPPLTISHAATLRQAAVCLRQCIAKCAGSGDGARVLCLQLCNVPAAARGAQTTAGARHAPCGGSLIDIAQLRPAKTCVQIFFCIFVLWQHCCTVILMFDNLSFAGSRRSALQRNSQQSAHSVRHTFHICQPGDDGHGLCHHCRVGIATHLTLTPLSAS